MLDLRLPLVARALSLMAGSLALAGCNATAPEETGPSPVGAVFVPPDGNWTVLAIDGRPVEPDSFRVRLAKGEVTGGRDGCNNWGYVAGAKPLPDGGRMIESDAQYCPETEQSRAYRSVIFEPEITPAGSDRLLLSGRGHRLLVARCEWRTVREERAGTSSEVRQCQPLPAASAQ
jgi:hypothetical protein